MSGGPRIEVAPNLYRHVCNCDKCKCNGEVCLETLYYPVCCVQLKGGWEKHMLARMTLSEHLLAAHGVKKPWESIPYQEIEICGVCDGESHFDSVECSLCQDHGWVIKQVE